MDIEIIESIQNEKKKEIGEKGLPPMNDEISDVASKKRMTVDEPPVVKKVDPLR